MLRALLILALLAPSPLLAQEARPGVAVDARGGAVIDPTKNVLDLVKEAIGRQDDLRGLEVRLQNSLREAETRRINELNIQKQGFDLELSKLLRESAEKQATLLATQLREVKTDLSDRVAKLEQFRWESGGRNSGQGDTIAWIMTGVMALIALGGLTTAVVVARRRPA